MQAGVKKTPWRLAKGGKGVGTTCIVAGPCGPETFLFRP